MSSDSSDFAVLLNRFLNADERSSAWLARRIGVHRGTVSRWLNGETVPRQADVVHAIGAALALPDQDVAALLHVLDLDIQGAAERALPPVVAPSVNGQRQPAGPGDQGRTARSRPDALWPLVGRDEELEMVCARLRVPQTRLLTIIGPGGIGKTRLATETAWLLEQEFDVLCALSFSDDHEPARDPDAGRQLLHRISDALDVPFDDGVPQSEQLLAFLRNRKALLVLHSFEEALDQRNALDRLIQATDRLQVLVTSQERVNLPYEAVIALAGLACPPQGTPAALLPDYSATRLFVARLRQVTPAFTVDEGDAPAIVTICNAVAGFPLGLLLAAGMYIDLPCREIAALLQDAPAALHARAPGIEPRHSQLDAVFTSAWQRTIPQARRLLCALAVFQQSFTRDDAQEVLGRSALQLTVDGRSHDGIVYLLRRSFLRIDRASNRYVMDPPLARFVATKRAAHEDAATVTALRRRHAAYFSEKLRAVAAAPLHEGAEEARFLDAWYDVRAALFWRLEQEGVDAVRDDVNLACAFFDLRSRHQDVIDFLDDVLARAQRLAAAPDKALPAQWLFRKGEAHYKNGELRESREVLLTTLERLGEATDMLRAPDRHKPRILPELLTQIRLRALPDRLKRPAPNAANLELRARVFAILAQIFFFDDQAALTEYVVLRAANLAEQADAPLELQARGLVNLCVGLSLDPMTRRLAPVYAHRALGMVQTLQHTGNLHGRAACAYVLVVLTMYEVAMSNLPAAQRHAILASRINRDLGKYRGYVESATMEICVAELSGEHGHAWAAWRELRDLAEERGDAQIWRWAVAGELENRFRLGLELAVDLEGVRTGADLAAQLADLIEASRAEDDSSVLLNLHGLLALVSLRHGLDDRLPDDLRRLHAEVTAADFTKITDFFGYAAAAEAGVGFWDRLRREGRTLPAPQHAEMTAMATAMCAELEAYAHIFPVARCRALTWRGLLYNLNGDEAKALRCWRQSVQRAEQLDLRFDQALAHFEQGRHAATGSRTRRVQLAHARALFQNMDNMYMVQLVDETLG